MTVFRPYELEPSHDVVDFLAPEVPSDLTNCDREPIHLSEAIQPYGVLLGVAEDGLIIRLASANTRAHLGADPSELLGMPLSLAIGAEPVDHLRDLLADVGASGSDPLICGLANGTCYELTWQRVGGLVVVELVPIEGRGVVSTATLYANVRQAMDALEGTETVQELCDVAASAIKSLTGYDRVMVYRFHPDEHGEVIAEEHEPGQEPFLGLNYPATDIPRQARKLYMLNHLRVIADVGYEPAALIGAPGRDGRRLDLSLTFLRSVSPVHLAYLTNMGVGATLTLSLLRGHRLWGMLACHHRSPKRIDAQTRATCLVLGRVFALQLVAHENRERQVYRARLAEVERQLVVRLSGGAASLAEALVDKGESPLSLTSADGMVARLNGRTVTAGSAPPAPAVELLLARLRSELDQVAFVCHDLPVRIPELAPYAEVAAGVLAVPLSAGYQDYLLWFRGELVHEVKWAGNPEQPKTVDLLGAPGEPQLAQLSPRQSFATWVQQVRQHSRPWLAPEIDAARVLGDFVQGVVLARSEMELLRQVREVLELGEVSSDSDRRDAREVRELGEVSSDSDRRDAREVRELGEVSSDSDRRDAREVLELGEVSSDSDRRGAREARERKEHAQAQSQRLESLGQLAGGVAHDFNNLLGVILNYAAFVSEEVLAAGLDQGHHLERAGADLAQITRAAERAAALTQQLLTFAQREVIRPQVLDVDDIVNGLEELLHRSLGEHVELVVSPAGDLWPILADAGQLEQVLVNLALNARDAMPEGGTLTIDTGNVEVDPETAADGSTTPGGRRVRLRVSDTGSGMPPDVLQRVFEPFYTTKLVGEGTGLGLATVHGIVARADGSIRVYSEPGIGTTFTITLPVTGESAGPLSQPVLYQRATRGETILLVEDDQAMREVTSRLLRRNGYQVIAASSGPEALSIADGYPGEIDLLVTDVVMPHMLGKEMAERMRLIRPTTAVVFMSGYARGVLASQGRLEPDVALLEKPFSEAELLATCAGVLDAH